MAVAVRGGRDAIAGVILHIDQGVHRRAGAGRLRPVGHPPVDGPARVGAGQCRDRVLALHMEFELRRLERSRPTPLSPGHALADRLRAQPHHPWRPTGASGVIDPLPATQRGAVLAGVNAKPCGWPAAGVDPRCGRHPLNPPPKPGSKNGPRTKIRHRRSPRFRGMANGYVQEVAGRSVRTSEDHRHMRA
jgi:hypothetical protein